MAVKEKEKVKSGFAMRNPEIETVGNVVQAKFPKEIYFDNCPVGEKELKKLTEFNKQYTEKIADETVNIAIEQFKKSEDVVAVVSSAHFMYDDTLTTDVNRACVEVTEDGEVEKPSVIQTYEQENFMKDKLKSLEEKISKSI